MARRQIVALLTCAALVVALPTPAAAALGPRAPSDAPVTSAPRTVNAVDAAIDTATTRISKRRLRGALPPARSFGADFNRENRPTTKIPPCLGRSVGPDPIQGAYANYFAPNKSVAVGVEAYPDARTAQLRFRALRREVIRSCDSSFVDQSGYVVQRARPIRRIGEQNWVRSYAQDLPAPPRSEFMVQVHRIGRFVVYTEIFGFVGITRDQFQRPIRRLGEGVRAL